jgi:hypothetical protein
MSFNIYQLDNLSIDEAEPILDDYQDEIIELFVNSAEGQEYLENNPEIGGWIGHFIYYGFAYEGFTLPQITKNETKLVLESLFPRKISLSSPEEADLAITELIAFWQFLKREYQLKNADSILKYLNAVKPKFRDIMNDSSKFGMAKSFFMMGQKAGFDMTTQEGLEEFTLHYNINMAPKLAASNTDFNEGLFDSANELGLLPEEGEESRQVSASEKTKRKKRNNMAKQSRKRNRQKRK